MRYLLWLFIVCLYTPVFAQKRVPMPHGMVFGKKPDTTQVIPAWRVELFMDKKIRISTTIRGRITKITKQKGGWFEMDAGKGKIIAAHFTDYKIDIPLSLTGKIAYIEGIAQKQLVADDKQHYAGSAAGGKKPANINPKRKLIFEVEGLMVDM